jgi:hypothetical protein
MSRSTSSSVSAQAAVVTALGAILAMTGCGLTVTQDRPTYEQLETHEKNVVDIVLAELAGFNKQVELRTPLSIASIIDKNKINVSFDGNIFSGNLGDGVIHVAPWENLDQAQRDLIKGWFKASSEASAKATYEKFFYRFLTISQGGKQYMYEALTTEWVFANRSLFNVERDTLRETLSYYRTIGKKSEMWTFATNACKPILEQYGASLGNSFNKKYLNAHFQELANPKAPSGYMYFICRWIEMGKVDAVDLTTELLWVRDLPKAKQGNNG